MVKPLTLETDSVPKKYTAHCGLFNPNLDNQQLVGNSMISENATEKVYEGGLVSI